MDRHWAYCSACDRQVEVVVRPGPGSHPGVGGPAKEVVCLAYGHSCTGALCPLTDRPPAEMGEALDTVAPPEPAEEE